MKGVCVMLKKHPVVINSFYELTIISDDFIYVDVYYFSCKEFSIFHYYIKYNCFVCKFELEYHFKSSNCKPEDYYYPFLFNSRIVAFKFIIF